MDDFFSPDAAPPGKNHKRKPTVPYLIFSLITFYPAENVAQVEEIEIIPDQAAAPVDLSAEFAELNDAAPVMQEGLYIDKYIGKLNLLRF